MKTKKLLPYFIIMLLFSVVLLSTTESKTETKKIQETKTSQKASYTFSLQLFQII